MTMTAPRVDPAAAPLFARPELIDLLEAAERPLEATGPQVDRCAVHGTEARTGS